MPLKYKNISSKSLKEIKECLNELKNCGIYDYNNKSNYIKFFTYLYGKKETIDFLRTKNINEIQLLQEKLDPTDSKLYIKNLNDTYNCVGFFADIKKLNDNTQIFEYLKKNIDDKRLKEFKNFSNIYPSIIELDGNFDLSVNHYAKVNDIIKEATFKFDKYAEYFIYKRQIKNEKYETKGITIKELMYLKNQIIIEEEIKKLLFFKDLIKSVEIINDEMNYLRAKGSSSPITIDMEIKYPNVKYKLKDEDNVEFQKIKNYLFNATDNLKAKLDSVNKDNPNLRFIYETGSDSMKEEILNKENENIKNENKSIEIENENIKNENKSLKIENENIKNENKFLEIEKEKLKNENKSLKIENVKLNKENKSIGIENEKIKNENQMLKNQINLLKKEIDNLKIKLDKLNLIKDEEIIKSDEKYKKLNDGKMKIADELISKMKSNIVEINNNTLLDGEKLIAINFKSVDQRINHTIICKNLTGFYEIEKELYTKYPDYAENDNYFMFNGSKINRWKTLEENNIRAYTIMLI